MPTEQTTLCGTCRWWDHAMAEKHGRKYPKFPYHRISVCTWAEGRPTPQWARITGDHWTNEAGVLECATWEELNPTEEEEVLQDFANRMEQDFEREQEERANHG